MDYEEIKKAFFTDRAHDLVLYSAKLESSPLSDLMRLHGITNFYEADLTESEIRTLGAGLCPVFILGSEWIMEKNLSAVDALMHLLKNSPKEQLGYRACFYLVPPDLLGKIIGEFFEVLARDRSLLTATKGESKSYYTDMIRYEVVTYAYYSLTPLPKGTFHLR